MKGAVVQARMASTRLPGKVLLPFGPGTVLEQVVDRLGGARSVDVVIVATSELDRDDPIAELAAERGYPCVRGDEQDVLSRFATAVETHALDVVVRVTSDCPFCSPEEVDRVVAELDRQGLDYVTNEGCVHGLNVEVARASALLQAHATAHEPYDREHVMPALYRPGSPWRAGAAEPAGPRDRPDLRFTLDTSADYGFLCAIRAAAEQARADPTPEWLAATVDGSEFWTGWQRRVLEAAGAAASASSGRPGVLPRS